MPVQKYFERMRYIDYLINHKATGTLNNLSGKLQLSKKATIICLNEMKELGFPIKYCRKRNSYYYSEEGRMTISLFEKMGGGGKICIKNFVKKDKSENTGLNNYNLVFWFYCYSIIKYPNGTKFSYKPGQCCSKIYAVA